MCGEPSAGVRPLREVARAGLLAVALVACVPGLSASPYPEVIERGNVALALGDAEDAADAFRQAMGYRREDPRALHGLARSYLARGDGETALEVLFRLKRSEPAYFAAHAGTDFEFALYQSAKGQIRRGESYDALRWLRRLERINPDHAGLDELLARTLIAEGGRLQVAGQPEEAAALFAEAVGRQPLPTDIGLALARSLIEAGRIDTAISVLSDELARDPDQPEFSRLMDRALMIRYPD